MLVPRSPNASSISSAFFDLGSALYRFETQARQALLPGWIIHASGARGEANGDFGKILALDHEQGHSVVELCRLHAGRMKRTIGAQLRRFGTIELRIRFRH